LLFLGSPPRHASHRPFERDTMVALAAHEQCCINVSRVYEVL
jgi:hypothetical protein